MLQNQADAVVGTANEMFCACNKWSAIVRNTKSIVAFHSVSSPIKLFILVYHVNN